MKFMHKILRFVFIVSFLFSGIAAYPAFNIDSLQRVLKKADDSKKPAIYLEIAKGYYESEKYDEAIDYLNKAIKIANGREKNEVMMKVYNILGDSYDRNHQVDIAISNLDKSLEIAKSLGNIDYQTLNYLYLAYCYQDKLEYQKAIDFCNKSIEVAAGQENNENMMSVYFAMGNNYWSMGNVEKALKSYLKALDIANAIKDKKYKPKILNAIGVSYKTKGEYQKAIEYFQQNLKVQEAKGDSVEMGKTLNNIGNVYSMFGIYSKAIECYQKSLVINHNLKKESTEGYLLLNIGVAYEKNKQNNKAIDFLRKSQAIFQKIQHQPGLAKVKNELGSIYSDNGNIQMALKNQEEALEVYKKLGDKINIASTLEYLGSTHSKAGNLAIALNYYNQSMALEKQMGMKKELIDDYKSVANVHSIMGDYKSAFENFQIYSNLKDTLLNDSFLKQIQEMEAKYENDKKENEIKLQKSEISKKELEAKRKNFIIYSFAFFIVVILAFSFLLYRQFAEKKKANILLAEQNDEITKQRDQIFQQKKEITDSIHYASRIQRAVLPSPKLLEDNNLQYFILYKPRDIVSGDFYWMNQKDNRVIIAAADCTGHGVPGAFMSMLGMALLNEIISKGEFHNAADILDQLRNLVVKSLHQSGKSEETKDGMDISLCMIDKENNNIQFAGAFNSMYIIRGSELLEANADRMPVGFHDKLNVPFTNTVMQIQKDDSLYIFSDGYIDQFGGENGKKFMAKKFKQFLLSIQGNPMEHQKELLDKNITDWRGELDQVDDIMVIGIKV
jgi:tetratricopeptide (TPR) repeat protein